MTDVKVVAPMNMGNTLVFKDKVYNVNVWVDALDGKGVYGPLTPIVTSEEEVYRVLTLDNLGTYMKYDKATKTLFTYRPTWDIFNYS